MNYRQERILDSLKKTNEKISVNDLSKTFFVSRRTIFNDLNCLDKFLNSSGYKILRDDDGIILKKVDLNKCQEIDVYDFYSSNRSLFLLKNILFDKINDIYALESILYVSYSTIIKDINYINNFYFNDISSKLSIIKDEIIIDSSEEQIQRIYVKFNETIFKKLRLMLIESKDLYRNYYKILSNSYGNDLVLKVKNILYTYLTHNSKVLAEYYFDNIINYLIVLVYRKINVEYEDFKYKGNLKIDLVEPAKQILNIIENKFNIKFSVGEYRYFYDILKANNIKNNNDIDKNEISYIVNTFLKALSELLKINLTNDYILVDQLEKHFPSMIDRLNNDISIDNPFIDEIKNEYSTLFNSIWLVIIMNQDLFTYSLNDQEIGLLTIYIQSSIDRNNTKGNVILNVQNKYHNYNYMLNRIKKVLPNANITVKYGKIDPEDDSDMIIVTENDVDYGDIPTVKVTPIISEKDLKRIATKYYSSIFKDKSYASLKNVHNILDILSNYFSEELSFFREDFKTRYEMMDFAINKLVSLNIVDNRYRESILKREKMGNTSVGYLIATPHGNPDFVKKSCILFLSNIRTVNWDGEKVNIMIMVNINREDILDIRTIFNFIYEISQDKDFIYELLQVKGYKEFLELIGSKL